MSVHSISHLHSNMDRLKAIDDIKKALNVTYLHSNMDRLKDQLTITTSDVAVAFTFQYG